MDQNTNDSHAIHLVPISNPPQSGLIKSEPPQTTTSNTTTSIQVQMNPQLQYVHNVDGGGVAVCGYDIKS